MVLLYPSPRVAQRRLRRLFGKGAVQRYRESLDLPYVYHVDKRPAQASHTVGINWARIYLETTAPEWLKPQTFFYAGKPIDFGFLKPDGLALFKSESKLAPPSYTPYFIEFDQSTRSNNGFDKAEKYARLYDSPQLWQDEIFSDEKIYKLPDMLNVELPPVTSSAPRRDVFVSRLVSLPTSSTKKTPSPRSFSVVTITEHPQRVKLIDEKFQAVNASREEGKIIFKTLLLDTVKETVLSNYFAREGDKKWPS